MIHQSSKVGYACHFRSLYPLWGIHSPSSLTNLAFISTLKVRSIAAFSSHPSHTAPYATPHWDATLRPGIKRWIKSEALAISSPVSHRHQQRQTPGLHIWQCPYKPGHEAGPVTHSHSLSLSVLVWRTSNNTSQPIVKLCSGLSSFKMYNSDICYHVLLFWSVGLSLQKHEALSCGTRVRFLWRHAHMDLNSDMHSICSDYSHYS